MKLARLAVLSLLLVSATAMASPAKDSTVSELLKVTNARKLVDGIRAQMDGMMDRSIQSALEGKKPNRKQKAAINKMKKHMVALLGDELGWKRFKPMTVRLYKETFTEEELQGILKFYKTPAGQAMIRKMPTLMQKTMIEVQKMTNDALPKMVEIQREFQKDMKAASGH